MLNKKYLWFGREIYKAIAKVISRFEKDSYRFFAQDQNIELKEKKSENIIVKQYIGNSIFVLDHIKEDLRETVDIIYLDPPYNTSASVAYEDNYESNTWASLIAGVLSNLEPLCSKENCVLYFSIDTKMASFVEWLVKQNMPSMKHVATIVWYKRTYGKNFAKKFRKTHEYIFVFCNNDKWEPGKMIVRDIEIKKYKNIDNDPRGPWKPEDLTAPKMMIANEEQEKRMYDFFYCGKIFRPGEGRVWRYSQEKMLELAEKNLIYANEKMKLPYLKVFLHDTNYMSSPPTVWDIEEVGSARSARAIEKEFPTPKPTSLLENLISVANIQKETITILDPFSGSGTIARAAVNYAKKNKKNVKIILIELDQRFAYALLRKALT